jgi:formate C-acetyltransferase
VHHDSPKEFLRAAGELAKEGIGLPAFFNDDAIIPVLLEMGVRLEEARDYAEVGCVEPQSPGRTNGFYTGGFLNLGKVLTLALNNGIDPVTGQAIGLSDDSFSGFSSQEEVLAAFNRQVEHFVKLMVMGDNILDRIHGQLAPNPFVSLLVDDCLIRGRSYEEGGAVHNYTSPNVVGLANVADSLMAIRHAVFNENLIKMEALLQALSSNFDGRKRMRKLLINRAPKYGNDNAEVDGIAREISSVILKSFKRYRNARGGTFEPGLQSISAHALFQGAVGATPDGRFRETLLADGGISPAQGRDRNGPTAVIRSAARLDHLEATNGALLNLKLNPDSVTGEEGTQNLVALIRSYFKMGGQHIQFNIISSKTLRDAQKHPEDHPNLIVRVAGFSVLFTAIDTVLQNDIIERTEHNL